MLMPAGDLTDAAVVALFGDPLRARIVRLLAREHLCTRHLVDETGARQPTVSHHLRTLREAGLVDTEPRGRFTYYRLRADTIAEVARAIGNLAADAERARNTYRPCG